MLFLMFFSCRTQWGASVKNVNSSFRQVQARTFSFLGALISSYVSYVVISYCLRQTSTVFRTYLTYEYETESTSRRC